jgi:hypothetical protein
MHSVPCSARSKRGRSASPRRSNSCRVPPWVWGVITPLTKLLLTLDVGERTLAMAQRVVHQVVEVLAPGCVPLFLTDRLKKYATTVLTHFGLWVQPRRRTR